MTYVTTVLADNPVHYWRLADAAAGLFFDIGSSPLHAYSFGVPYGPFTSMCSDGLCWFRMNTTPFFGVRCDQSDMTLTTSFTLEAWFYSIGQGTSDQNIMSVQNPGGSRATIRYNSGRILQGFIATQPTASNPATTPRQAWHHAVLTYDHVTLRLYLDGAQVATQAFVINIASTDYNVLLGEESSNVTPLNGFMAEFAIYSSALSASRVLAHFNAADTRTSTPRSVEAGAFPPGPSVALSSSDLLNQIYAAVHKVF